MGLFDDIADVATGAKKKEDTVTYQQAQNNPNSQEAQWMANTQVQQSFNAAETQGQQERDKAKKEDRTIQTQEQVVAALPDPVPKVIKKKKKKKQSILSKIGHGDIEEDYIGDDEFLATLPEGQHKLRTQFDRLLAKYGTDFYDPNNPEKASSQAKLLLSYLSGVPYTKGGGMGAPDPNYGGGDFDLEGITPAEFDAAEKARQDALKQMKGIGSLEAAQSPGTAQTLTDLDKDLLRTGLTGDQYYNYMQQLMQSNVPAYQQAFPWSSGAAIPAIGKALISPMTTVGTGIYNALTGKKNEPKLDPIFTGEPLDPKLFYDLDEIEQSGLMGTEVAMNAQNQIDYNDPDDPDDDPPPGYDSWGEFYAATGISEGEGKWVDGQYYFNYADGGIASLDNGQFDTAEADSLMFRDPVENDEWEYNV
jgi:hypothetical protein